MAGSGAKIRFFDAAGREFEVSRTAYREKVLPTLFAGVWKDRDRLYAITIQAIQDGFLEEAIKGAQQLHKLEKGSERSTTALGTALMQAGRVMEARSLFEAFLSRTVSPAVLTNYAKILDTLGDKALAEKALRESLRLDPNQGPALAWYAAIHRDRSGADGYEQALREVAEEEQSWLAQLLLARSELQRKNLQAALATYRQILSAGIGGGDALTIVSGDLAASGHPSLAVELVGPVYECAWHGPFAGLNLARAYAELGQSAAADKILDELDKLDRPDVKHHIARVREEATRDEETGSRLISE